MNDLSWDELKAMEPIKDHDGHIKDWLTKLYAKGDALKEKAEKWTYFIEGADKDTVMDLSAWMSDIHKLENAKKHFMNFKSPYAGMCDDCLYPLELKTLEGNCGRCAAGTLKFWMSELGGLLGVDSKCPACGAVTLESPCPFCTNDVGMPSGG